MNIRHTLFLLFALIGISIGANPWLDIAGAEHGEVVRRRTLASGADNAVVIEIVSAGGRFVRLEHSDRWRISAPFRAAADQTAISMLADLLAFTPLIDSIDEVAAAKLGRIPSDFGLDRPTLSIRVVTPVDETLIRFGSRLPTGEGVYATVDGSPVVYVVPNEIFAAADLTVDSWRRRTVFRVKPDEVTSIDIRRGNSSVRLARTGERWEMTEPRKAMAASASVKRIIDTVLSCEALKFVWPVGASNETVTASVALLAGYGLDPESCETVVFRTGDGRDHSISFGSAADPDSVYALVHAGTAVATVTAEAKASVSLDVSSLIDGRLFPFEKSAIQRISLIDGDVAYLLARGDNATWRLDSPVSAAADDTAVAALIDKLLVMRSVDLDENGVKVSLSADSSPVSVSKAALLGSGGFEQLRSKIVLDIDAATVRRLVISPAGSGGHSAAVFDPDRKGWNVESSVSGGVIDPVRLNAVLAALSPLKARSVARLKVSQGELARFGLETPSCVVAVDRLIEGSVRRNILIGNAITPGGDAYATVGSSDAVFVLDGDTVGKLTSGVFTE